MIMSSVSAIICAFNEERTISSVIETAYSYPCIEQVVVINDGSTDSTGFIINSLSESIDITYINLLPNKGKGYSMASGLELSTGDIIVFLDADIVNLSPRHIDQLVLPILDGQADMVMGQPSRTFINTRYNPFKNLTGQRAVKREQILPITNDIRFTRFGVETYINLYYQSEYLNTKRVILEDLAHPTKFGKMKMGQAILEYLKAGNEIMSTLISNIDLVEKSIKRRIITKRITLE